MAEKKKMGRPPRRNVLIPPGQKRPPGRPPRIRTQLLNQRTVDKICEIIALGGSDAMAARAGGISAQTLKAWKRIGDEESQRRFDGEQPVPELDDYVIFWDYYQRAENEPLVDAITLVNNRIKDGNDINSAWKLLEKKDASFAQRQNINVKHGGKVTTERIRPLDPQPLPSFNDYLANTEADTDDGEEV